MAGPRAVPLAELSRELLRSLEGHSTEAAPLRHCKCAYNGDSNRAADAALWSPEHSDDDASEEATTATGSALQLSAVGSMSECGGDAGCAMLEAVPPVQNEGARSASSWLLYWGSIGHDAGNTQDSRLAGHPSSVPQVVAQGHSIKRVNSLLPGSTLSAAPPPRRLHADGLVAGNARRNTS